MIDNFSLFFFTLCVAVSIVRAVKLERGNRRLNDPQRKNLRV